MGNSAPSSGQSKNNAAPSNWKSVKASGDPTAHTRGSPGGEELGAADEAAAEQASTEQGDTGEAREGAASASSGVTTPAEVPPAIWDGDEFSCSICARDLEEGERAARLRCRHCYHADCWNTGQEHVDTCPNCTAPAHLDAVWTFIGPRPSTTQGQPNLIGSFNPVEEHELRTPRSVNTDYDLPHAGSE